MTATSPVDYGIPNAVEYPVEDEGVKEELSRIYTILRNITSGEMSILGALVKTGAIGQYESTGQLYVNLPGGVPDYGVPLAATGIVITSGLTSNYINWNSMGANFLHMEIWTAPTNSLTAATYLGSSTSSSFTHAVGLTNKTTFYWIRAVSRAFIIGPYNAGETGGTGATTSKVGGVDLFDLIITSQKLAADTVGSVHMQANSITAGNGAIANLAVTNAKIADLVVDKLTGGTIGAQTIYLGNTSFRLDGGLRRLIISDGTYDRVSLGDLGAGVFGLTLRDLSGNIFLDSGGIRSSPFFVRGNGVITGNSVQKVGGIAAWDSDAYSQGGFSGGAVASARAAQVNAELMFGLNADPALDQSFTSLDYAIHLLPDGTLRVSESGLNIGAFGTYTTTDFLSVSYDGLRVSYAKNGVELRGVTAASGLVLFFDSSFYTPGAQLNNISFRDLPGLSALRITAGTITGSTLQTAASGQRFVVSRESGYGEFYDSAGNLRSRIGFTAATVAGVNALIYANAGVDQVGAEFRSVNSPACYTVSADHIGVYGQTASSSQAALHGYNSGSGPGVFGQGSTGPGGRFSGAVTGAAGIGVLARAGADIGRAYDGGVVGTHSGGPGIVGRGGAIAGGYFDTFVSTFPAIIAASGTYSLDCIANSTSTRGHIILRPGTNAGLPLASDDGALYVTNTGILYFRKASEWREIQLVAAG